MKYTQFDNINLKDTKLISNNSYVYDILKKNNIDTVAELFFRDDNNSINYGPNSKSEENFMHEQIKGIIKLMRYKYLNEPFNIENILNKTYKTPEYCAPVHIVGSKFNYYQMRFVHSRFKRYATPESKEIDYDFKRLGFNNDEIDSLILSIYNDRLNYKDFTLIQALSKLDINADNFKSLSDIKIFQEKVETLSRSLTKTNRIGEISVAEASRLREELKRLEFLKKEIDEKIKNIKLELNNNFTLEDEKNYSKQYYTK